YARTRVRAYAPDKPTAVHAEEARARTAARNAAWGWAAATKKTTDRLDTWVTNTRRARELGTAPGLLHEFIREAAQRAGLDETATPPQVWAAADPDSPR
ncbi:MAG: hypothetical protein ACRDRO_30030, partial [Pseudonocardiaceae bacterium]